MKLYRVLLAVVLSSLLTAGTASAADFAGAGAGAVGAGSLPHALKKTVMTAADRSEVFMGISVK